MPYKSPEQVKEKVRGTEKLTEKQRRQFMHVFNQAYEEGKGDAKSHQLAWGVVKKSSDNSPFSPGFPEMTDDDWKALEKSHREKYLRREKEWAEERKQMKQEFDEEDREWKRREKAIHDRVKRELHLSSELLSIAKDLLS